MDNLEGKKHLSRFIIDHYKLKMYFELTLAYKTKVTLE